MTDPAAPQRVLYLIACGSPRSAKIGDLITRAQSRGWNVYVATTPTGRKFVDIPAIERLTGEAVRSEYDIPNPSKTWPAANAMLACPATFNTINKWAAGMADNLALSLLTEAVGLHIPLVAAPALNTAQEKHIAFRKSVETLRAMGVTVIYGPGTYEPTTPGTGGRKYNFDLPLNALERG